MRAQIPLILALLAAPLLVSATDVEEYFPIRVGASWTYHMSKERVTTVGDKIVEERITGKSVERVVKLSDEIMRSHGLIVDSRPYERAEEALRTSVGEFRCLRISARGPVTGELPGMPPVRITTGSVEATSWFAKGIGLVKQVQVLKLNLELPNGVTTKTEERKIKELSAFIMPPFR